MRRKREILLNCIYGVDIDPQAVEVAQLSLYLKLMEDETTFSARHQQLEMGMALLPSLENNIVEANSLVTLDEDLFSIEKLREPKSLDFRAAFHEVFDKGGFDLLIGNPPYIKEYTNRNAFEHVRTSPYFLGKMDIWYLFACRGLDWLKPDTGMLAFIATNNWVTNAGAKRLREKITREGRIEQLIDFGNYKVFRDAGIQTMILIVRRSSEPETYTFDYRRLGLPKPTQRDAQALLQRESGHGLEYLTPKFDRRRRADAPLTFSHSAAVELLDKLAAAQNFYLDGDKEIAQGIVPNIDVVSAKGIKLIPLRRRQAQSIQVGDGVFVVDVGKFRSPTHEKREFSQTFI
jgi:adenine-specific DNA-methyltransferase